jgi:hypothetical protein
MDGNTDPLISAATADIALHGRINFLIGWVRIMAEQGGRGHDLSGVAIAALRDLFFDPGFLYGMVIILRKAFDCGYLPAGGS